MAASMIDRRSEIVSCDSSQAGDLRIGVASETGPLVFRTIADFSPTGLFVADL
jgi:hypothetical protein